MDSDNKGYKRKRKEKETGNDSYEESDEEIEVTIPITKRAKPDVDHHEKTEKHSCNNDSQSPHSSNHDEKDDHDQTDIHMQIRYKLNKSTGYKPDLSKLPKPPEEEFFKPELHQSAAEKKRILEQAPAIFESRVGPNVNAEQARKAQKATFNKMLARSCGRSRKGLNR